MVMGSGRPIFTLGSAVFVGIFLLCALINGGCAEGVAGEECVSAATSDLYDYAQLVFFMALGAGTKQFFFSSNRLDNSAARFSPKVAEEDDDLCAPGALADEQ